MDISELTKEISKEIKFIYDNEELFLNTFADSEGFIEDSLNKITFDSKSIWFKYKQYKTDLISRIIEKRIDIDRYKQWKESIK